VQSAVYYRKQCNKHDAPTDQVIKHPAWSLQFYAPFCGLCKRIRPIWIELAAALRGKAYVASVDCAQHWEACKSVGISGYPSIKKFSHGKSEPEDYEGERSIGALSTFATG
jgi:thiol-disulfide isomerase/thioredoxin